ncbi:MAG: type II toxin-antitoxin system VapC family toxin [Rubrobacter sp.]|nr:type II toxin-antitoxin system VapC family toxin [Rubrobacter sp.]MDQ3360786.1 type II toxin-antitoxin system VapC family toxin [Actinomycetota bacterium]MDQ3377773.1 type II toxin-antitoxin system VapC family toxin [Actinomycetota bacterium]
MANVVDSSGWIEYFADGPNADFFASVVEDTGSLVVPSITLYEVFKRLLVEPDGEEAALEVVAAMQQGLVVALSPELALAAAKISSETKLPMADSVILATAREHDATLWTQDSDFEGVEDVNYVKKA